MGLSLWEKAPSHDCSGENLVLEAVLVPSLVSGHVTPAGLVT